jgi:tetratricopeptide (TPR) repeat protein
MSLIVKALRALGLAAAAVLAVALFRNGTVTEFSKGVEDPAARVALLGRADRPYPFNDRTLYELGKAYLDLGMRETGRGDREGRDFLSAVGNLRRSLELNPCSPFAHFALAQALFYADTALPSGPSDAFREYRLAAEMAGRNSQIFFEVGRVLMSRWKDIGDSERGFASALLRSVLASGDPEKLQVLFSTWELNVLDYDVMDRLLPDEPGVHRAYARYLGERSLSLERRQKALSKAERLQFAMANSERDAGERARFNYRVPDSLEHFRTCLAWLGNIMFYQDLIGERLIDPEDYAKLRRTTLLELIRARIETGATLADIGAGLTEYLDLDVGPSAVSELGTLLQERGLMSDAPEKHIDDLTSLEIELRLYFLQNRYQDIIRIGRVLVQSVVVVPSEKKAAYIRILGLLGDAEQKVDYLYDAGDFYRRALELEPDNFDLLIKLRRNLRLLNDEPKVKEIQDRILAAVTRRSALTGISAIPKGSDFEVFLVLEGGDFAFSLVFEDAPKDPLPLITVALNHRVIWEGYVRAPILSLTAKAATGRNRLNVTAVNRGVRLASIDLKPSGPGALP